MIIFSLVMLNPRLVAFTWPSSSCSVHCSTGTRSPLVDYICQASRKGNFDNTYCQYYIVSLQVLPVRLTRVTPPLEPNCETNFLPFLLFLAQLCFKISTSRKTSHQMSSYMIPTWASMDFTVSCSRLGFFMLLTFACRCRINHTHGSQI